MDQHFRVADMIVLCPGCHDMATRGAFAEAEEREMQTSPCNLDRGYASGLLVMHQRFAAIRCGRGLLVGDGLTISIDDAQLLSIEVSADRRLELSIDLCTPEGEQVALIHRNEWLSGDAAQWDIVAEYRKLKLWSAKYRITLEVDATRVPVSVRADLRHHDHSVLLRPSGIFWGRGARPQTFIKDIGLVGISLAVDTQAETMRMIPYEGEGILIGDLTGPNPLDDCLRAWHKLKHQGDGLRL